MKMFDIVDSITFIYKGVLEVFTELDGVEFVLERLHPGSCLNYRAFFREDQMEVSVRCLENCQLYNLTQDAFEKVLEDSHRSKKNLMIHKVQMFSQKKEFPLDYILKTPSILIDRSISHKMHH